MTQKQQLRNGLYAIVAVISFVVLSFALINTQKIYSTLQRQLAESNIQLQANQLSISLMYTGSLRLDNVHIQAGTFDMEAQRLFIDLDLPALLTGKALPQALFLQSAIINITQDKKQAWLKLLGTDNFKLKRIDISQSEIHFEQQHITLEKADLDIRDIGKNKNPRMELRAHIGDGRIDAHGYLNMKRGIITKGFSRVKLYDIPLSAWTESISLNTLSGSITTHLNQDSSWQSFGHITAKGAQDNLLEIRGKVTGSEKQFLHVEDIVLSNKEAGAIQVNGACSQRDKCLITVKGDKIVLNPLRKLLQTNVETDGYIHSVQLQMELNQGVVSSSGKLSWSALNIHLPASNENVSNNIVMDAGYVRFDGLNMLKPNQWVLKKAALTPSKEGNQEIIIQHGTLVDNTLNLPISLNQATYWLPISQWIAYKTKAPILHGAGPINGDINLTWVKSDLTEATVALNADQAKLSLSGFSKPQGITMQVSGKVLWEQEKMPSLAQLGVVLDESTFQLNQKNNTWSFQGIDIDFDSLQEVGIKLPPVWEAWHGYIRGSTTLFAPETDIIIQDANVDLIDFGWQKHQFNGQVQVKKQKWYVKNLRWDFQKNHAEIFSRKTNHFDIIAESLDSHALLLVQRLPFHTHGKLYTKSLLLPFGTLKQVSSKYETNEQGLVLKQFKSVFYEGSLSSKQVQVTPLDDAFMLQGTIQVGGIHLNNWLWLHKQFGTHLEATIYATLNLQGNFDIEHNLTSWKGDGDVAVYNGKWLFHDKNIAADKINLNLRKRKEFHADFKIKDGEKYGIGSLGIDEKHQVSGLLKWQRKTYHFSKLWPNFRYEETSP